ncbi:hypothetical protein VTK26DRAFT_6323 [Humicola hyalothermophila]
MESNMGLMLTFETKPRAKCSSRSPKCTSTGLLWPQPTRALTPLGTDRRQCRTSSAPFHPDFQAVLLSFRAVRLDSTMSGVQVARSLKEPGARTGKECVFAVLLVNKGR